MGFKKPGLAHKKSIVAYNSKMSDITNKERKLKRHLKKHPLDVITILSIMQNYIKKRVVRSKERLSNILERSTNRKLTS